MLSSSSGAWTPRVRTTPGEKRSCPGTYARLSPHRPCNECARRAVSTSAETGKLAVAALNHSCRAQKRAALQQWTIYRRFGSLHDACVHKGELASDWCEKPVLTTRSRAASRAFSTARARCWTSLYYLLEDRSSRGPRAGAGRVSWTHRRSLHHSSESSSQLRGALSAWLWKREEVERRRLHGRRTRTVATSPCRGSRSDASPRRESCRIAPACGPH